MAPIDKMPVVLHIITHDEEPYTDTPFLENYVKRKIYDNMFCIFSKQIGYEPVLFSLSTSIRKVTTIRHKDGYEMRLIPVAFKVIGTSGSISPALLLETRKFIKERKPKIVHIHGYYTVSFEPLAAMLCQMKVPFIAHYHGTPMSPVIKHYKRVFLPIFLSKATLVVSPSRREINYLKSIGVKAPLEFQIDPIDLSKFNPVNKAAVKKRLGINPKKTMVLFLSRFFREKNPLSILRAFKKTQERLPNICIRLAGKGPLYDESRLLAKKLHIDDCEFLGYVDNKTRILLMQAADLFVLPSIGGEAAPYVLKEATACGTPCLATDIGGVADVIFEGKNGIILKMPITEDKLEKTMFQLLCDKPVLEKMGRFASKDTKRTYSHKNIRKEMLQTYHKFEKLAAKKSPKNK